MKKYNVAVVGATGAVGRECLKILKERDFPAKKLKLLASERSHGKVVDFNGENIKVEKAEPNSFEGIDIAIFSAGSKVSKQLAPEAVKRGAVVVDNSNAFRMDRNVPLVVPEVNPEEIENHNGIIANPNCSTIQMVVALKPIYDVVGIKRVVVSTYQAVSGTGLKAIEELKRQTIGYLNNRDIVKEVYPHQIAFNVLPHIDVFDEEGYTKEERKMINETKKILNDETIKVAPTTVRVPVITGHSESVNVETRKPISPQEVRELLDNAPGVVVMDEPESNTYPLPILAAGRNEVFVGRIRRDVSIENGIAMWIVADNLRKGAAFNAIQIAELLINQKIV